MSLELEEMIANIDKLDDQIFEIEQTIADKVNALRAKRNGFKQILDAEVELQANTMLDNKPYKCGTANIETSRHKIKVTVPKKVKWDEDQLKTIRTQVIASGKNPSDFIREKLSVTETMYKGFIKEIKDVFEPARTVSTGAVKIIIERK